MSVPYRLQPQRYGQDFQVTPVGGNGGKPHTEYGEITSLGCYVENSGIISRIFITFANGTLQEFGASLHGGMTLRLFVFRPGERIVNMEQQSGPWQAGNETLTLMTRIMFTTSLGRTFHAGTSEAGTKFSIDVGSGELAGFVIRSCAMIDEFGLLFRVYQQYPHPQMGMPQGPPY